MNYEQLHNRAIEAFKTDKRFGSTMGEIGSIARAIGANHDMKPKDVMALLNIGAIYDAWSRTFATGAKRPFNLLNDADALIESAPQEIEWQMKWVCGDFCNAPDTKNAMAGYAKKNVQEAVQSNLQKQIKLYRQCTSTSRKVDMFAVESKIEVVDGCAKINLTHQPFKEDRGVEPDIISQVISDFKEQFTIWPEFIDAIAAARFASDRREAFMWLQACSGWGKGLLIAVLDELGIVAELSVKEIEAAFEGRAVGISPDSFVRSWVINVDEFKTIKSEIKQINNKISLSPKFQLKSDVPVYFKLFTSAEDVASLTGSEGVEEQFSKRFAYYKPSSGSIDNRPVFKALGKSVYLNALASEIARVFNNYVEKMRLMGEEEATKFSDIALSTFNAKYSLSLHFDSLDNSIDEYAEEIKFMLKGLGKNSKPKSYLTLPEEVRRLFDANVSVGSINGKRVVLLRRPTTTIKAWLNFHVDRGQISKVSHKINDLIDSVNEVGSVTKSRRYTEVIEGKKGHKSQSTKGVAVLLSEKVTKLRCYGTGSADNVSFM